LGFITLNKQHLVLTSVTLTLGIITVIRLLLKRLLATKFSKMYPYKCKFYFYLQLA